VTLDLNVHRRARKIISSLPGWLLITMMIMVILRAIWPAAADRQCGVVTTAGFRAASPVAVPIVQGVAGKRITGAPGRR
jgi:hypothetical protein